MIRKATVHDIPAIKHCDSEIFGFNYPDNVYLSTIEENLSYVVETQGTVCGYVMITMNKAFDTIMTIGVLNAFQGKGYGKALLTRALSTVSGKITLSVKRENLIAINCYKSFGFKITDEDDFFDTYKMVKMPSSN